MSRSLNDYFCTCFISRFFLLLWVFVTKFLFLRQVFLNLYAFFPVELLADFFNFRAFACCYRPSFWLISLFDVEIVTSWYYFNVELHVNGFLNFPGIVGKKLSESGPILKECCKCVINRLYLSFEMLSKKLRLMGLGKTVRKILLSEVILMIEEMIELYVLFVTLEGEVFIWKLTTSKFIITLTSYIEISDFRMIYWNCEKHLILY